MNPFSSSEKKVCIIGAGPLGLSAAYYLLRAKNRRFNVTILEASADAGGLAGSHTLENGQCIEAYYHHIFSSDHFFLSLCKDLGIYSKVKFRKASIGHLIDSSLYSLSGPVDILTSSLLSPLNRLRFILVSIYLKSGIEKLFLGQTALHGSLKLYGSECTYRIWQPLLVGKYSNYSDMVPMSWLAARIRDRSIKLGYIDGGFDKFYKKLIHECKSLGAYMRYNKPVDSPYLEQNKVIIDGESYDACLSTIGPLNESLAHFPFPDSNVRFLGAICVVYEINRDPGIPYWTNICDPNSPVLAVINHRKLDCSTRFDNIYPVYSAAYVLPDADLFSLGDSELITSFFIPIQNLFKVNKNSQELSYDRATVYRTRYAQPVINPDIGLPPVMQIEGPLYKASMHSIYPNDRGQNYAIELGKRIALKITKDLH
ncbi:MAG: FAD-dependent oxidoreductase [Synechococcus sp.]|nr:FAD-dependent oxidoreductase [Synechococcus sp.]